MSNCTDLDFFLSRGNSCVQYHAFFIDFYDLFQVVLLDTVLGTLNLLPVNSLHKCVHHF